MHVDECLYSKTVSSGIIASYGDTTTVIPTCTCMSSGFHLENFKRRGEKTTFSRGVRQLFGVTQVFSQTSTSVYLGLVYASKEMF